MVVALGQVLAGKYRVDRVLGEGGMGLVLAATHLALQQRVALKLMLPHAAKDRAMAERFIREARAAVRLRSEHVGRVLDVGTLEDGAAYIVMEFLDGIDISEVLRRHGSLPVATACDYVLQTCVAVAEAHSQRIVHRDLKPANLFLTRGAGGAPLVKVLDFGISKVDAPEGGELSLTQTGVVLGSPSYMSPEQLRSTKDADARSDIWSLGVILYELVSGRVPFAADSFSAVCLQIAMSRPPPLRVPMAGRSGFEAVIQRCLEKDPAARWANVGELARALVPHAPPHGRAIADRVVQILRAAPAVVDEHAAPGPGAREGTISATLGEVKGRLTDRGSRGWLLAGGITVAVAGLALAVVIAQEPQRDGDVVTTPPRAAPATVLPEPPSPVVDAAPAAVVAPPAARDAGVAVAAPDGTPARSRVRATRPRPTAPRPAPRDTDPLGSAD